MYIPKKIGKNLYITNFLGGTYEYGEHEKCNSIKGYTIKYCGGSNSYIKRKH